MPGVFSRTPPRRTLVVQVIDPFVLRFLTLAFFPPESERAEISTFSNEELINLQTSDEREQKSYTPSQSTNQFILIFFKETLDFSQTLRIRIDKNQFSVG